MAQFESSNRAEEPSVSVRIYLPAEDLRGYVTFYYFVEAFRPLTDFLYPEWGNVRLAISGDWSVLNDPRDRGPSPDGTLFGPTDRRGLITTDGGKTVGFGLTPLGWERMIGQDADEMANRVRELQGELGVGASALCSAFISDGDDDTPGVKRFDRLLLDLVARRPASDPLALSIDLALRARPTDVTRFAEAVGVSPRTLQRLCLRVFGFPPKRLLRRQRFLETLGLMRVSAETPISALMDEEYFDRAHFNRDFRDFMGMTPGDYARTPRILMQAAATAQAGMGIPLSFKLPDPPTD